MAKHVNVLAPVHRDAMLPYVTHTSVGRQARPALHDAVSSAGHLATTR